MDKDWIPVITSSIAVLGTLLGVAVGGGINSILKFFELRHQRKLEREKILLSKLELLHQSIAEFLPVISKFIVGNIGAIEPPDTNLFMGKPLANISTLLNIYAPELKPDANKLSDGCRELIEIVMKKDVGWIDKSLEYQRNIFNICSDMNGKISNQINDEILKRKVKSEIVKATR